MIIEQGAIVILGFAAGLVVVDIDGGIQRKLSAADCLVVDCILMVWRGFPGLKKQSRLGGRIVRTAPAQQSEIPAVHGGDAIGDERRCPSRSMP